MELSSQLIGIEYTDIDINSILSSTSPSRAPFTSHFNQNEEFFLKLASEFTVPHLPIHHDVNQPRPGADYLAGLKEVIRQLVSLVPDLFADVTYFFDPFEILKPRFFKHYQLGRRDFLYILTLDLMFRSQEHTVVERGTNDTTPRYKTENLFVEGLFIPLEEVIHRHGAVFSFRVKQTLSDTWIGETGRGYFTKGIWMDDDLTKFFSKLLVPKTVKIYPFYPFVCRYKTICQNLIDLSPELRLSNLPHLHQALEFLTPFIDEIQEELRDSKFSEELDFFQTLKKKVPPYWSSIFQNIKIQVYLNKNDMREFKVET
jgi:hypothetical protein